MAIVAEKTEGGEYSVLPLGKYNMVLANMEESVGQFGPQWKWVFKTVQEEEDTDGNQAPVGTSIWGYTSQVYSEKSKAYAWAKALLGDDFDPEADFNSDNVVGRVALVKVEDYTNEEGKEKNKVLADMSPSKKYAGQVLDVGGTELSDYETAEELAEDIPF